MTEEEWLTCADPLKMLFFVEEKANARQMRLFTCACCRYIWDLIESENYRRMVEIAERFADGAGSVLQWHPASFHWMRRLVDAPRGQGVKEWEEALSGLVEEEWSFDYPSPEGTAAWTLFLKYEMAWVVASASSRLRAAKQPYWKEHKGRDLVSPNELWSDSRLQEEKEAQATLMRDIFGNPFRPITLNSAWRTSTVVQLAQSIYDDRAFDRMPEMADALAEAGCENQEILSHCRRPGPHVKGCWVVDLVLGKE